MDVRAQRARCGPCAKHISNREMRTSDGRPQGPTPRILSPLAPTIRRIGPPSPCIVGAGEDVDVGTGPLNPVWGTGRARRGAWEALTLAARRCSPPHLFSL